MLDKYYFAFVDSDQLSDKQIEEIYHLNLEVYPEFADYYHKNKYYSSVKPQMVLVVYDRGKLIATGKFLWRDIEVGKETFKLFASGLLVRADYQNMGIGSEMFRLYINKTKELGGDLLFGTTKNKTMVKLSKAMGFKELSTRITYKDASSGDVKGIEGQAFGYEFKEGLVNKINSLGNLFIGIGPV